MTNKGESIGDSIRIPPIVILSGFCASKNCIEGRQWGFWLHEFVISKCSPSIRPPRSVTQDDICSPPHCHPEWFLR